MEQRNKDDDAVEEAVEEKEVDLAGDERKGAGDRFQKYDGRVKNWILFFDLPSAIREFLRKKEMGKISKLLSNRFASLEYAIFTVRCNSRLLSKGRVSVNTSPQSHVSPQKLRL